jgi:hypothetical protein
MASFCAGEGGEENWQRMDSDEHGWGVTGAVGSFGNLTHPGGRGVGVCQVGTWLRFAVSELVASGCIWLQGLGSFCAGARERGAGWNGFEQIGAVWQGSARVGGVWRALAQVACLPSPGGAGWRVAPGRAREGMAPGKRLSRRARIVPLPNGGLVRACDENSGGNVVFGVILRDFWVGRGLRAARRGCAPEGA